MANRHVLIVLLAAITAGATAFASIFLLDQRSGSTIVIQDPIAETEIVVWIGGAVEKPGVYTLPAGSRLDDAIDLAGGLKASADMSNLNLAARLEDEERIEILFLPEPAQVQSGATPVALEVRATSTQLPVDTRIDINTADATTLESLPGVGPAIASRIIEYRTNNGPFERIEELASVNGISSKMVESLRDLITVGS